MEIRSNNFTIIRIVISGKVFDVSEDVLSKKPNTRLGKLAAQTKDYKKEFLHTGDVTSTTIDAKPISNENQLLESSHKVKTLYYDRPTSAFKAVLAYYQTGQLHMPDHICPILFQNELKFWGIPENTLENCCKYKYFAFLDDYETKTAFHDNIRTLSDTNTVTSTGCPKIRMYREKIWACLNCENKSLLSKVIMWGMLMCVVLSILTLSIGTMDGFKRRLNKCEAKEYFENLEMARNGKAFIKFNQAKGCDKSPLMDFHNNRSDPISNTTKTILYDRHPSLIIIDSVLIAIFTLELIIRLWTCPSLKLYIRDILNVIDLLILLTTVAELSIRYTVVTFRYQEKGVHVLYYMQMLRVLRILRYIRGFPSIQVLTYTLKSNYKDIFVMILYILIVISLFANFLYFAEDKTNIGSIPVAWWWGIITMTTVGYGDIVPKTSLGRFIGGLCALSGVFVFSLIIPVFVNTFVTFYRFSHLHKRFLQPQPTKIMVAPLTNDDTKTKY